MQMPSTIPAPGHLEHPPIREVACGVIFEPMAELDPMLVGTYWGPRRSEFPGRQLLPAIAEPLIVPFPMGMPALRSWLVTKDESFILQIQHDRFYVNWRRRGWQTAADDYPRFSDHEGKGEGILTRTMDEFRQFQEFCVSAIGRPPTVRKLELSKVDCLVEGQHWTGLADLARMLPWIEPFAGFAETSAPHLALRFTENRAEGQLDVSIASGQVVSDNKPVRVINLESRVSTAASERIKDDFLRLNAELNKVFVSLIPQEQLVARFGSQPKGG